MSVRFAQRSIARTEPAVVEVPLALELPTLPVYLSAHESVRHGPRVRKAWDQLAAGLRAVIERDAEQKPARKPERAEPKNRKLSQKHRR